MFKKIIFFFFCGLVVFFPTTNVIATQVYVGVEVASMIAPGYDGKINPNWCLPNHTQMVILNSSCSNSNLTSDYSATNLCSSYCSSNCMANVSTGVKYVTTTAITCAGDTIWSGPLNLTDDTGYKAYIYTPNFCSGYYDPYSSLFDYEAYAWWVLHPCYLAWTEDKDCNETCEHYGTVPKTDGYSSCLDYMGHAQEGESWISSYSAIDILRKSECGSRSLGSYSYYSKTADECYYQYEDYPYSDCTWSDPDYVRICGCKYDATASGFTFSFTSNF